MSVPAKAGSVADTTLRERGEPSPGPSAGPAPVEHAGPAPVEHAGPAPVEHAGPAPVEHAGPAAGGGHGSPSAAPLVPLVPGVIRELSRQGAPHWAATRARARQAVLHRAPDAVLPLADAAALVPAVLLAGVGGWQAGAYGALVLAFLAGGGLHRPRICLRVSDQAGRIFAAAAVPVLAVLAWTSAGGAVRLVLLATVLVMASRSAACAGLRIAHRRGLLAEPAVVVGTGSIASEVAGLLLEHPELGVSPRGFVGGAAAGGAAGAAADARPGAGLPLLGRPADLAAVVARHGIRRVIVCPGESVRGDAGRDGDLVRALRSRRPLPADVCVVPRLHQLGAAVPPACLDDVWGIPLIPLRRYRQWPAGQLMKRLFDVLAAAVLIVALAPVLVVIAVTVRLRSRGPALFRQVRVVAAGRLAPIIKLRTLSGHGDPDTSWSVPLERCGGFERWLRRAHLDELPQLANVLRGDMSLVGPRPERPFFTQRFSRQIQGYDDRHRMRAGLTGWAQVNGLHGDTCISDRARFDNHYIEYWSPWLDLVILARTLACSVINAATRTARASSGGSQ